MHGQIDPRNIEALINESEPTDGVLIEVPIPLAAFTLGTGLHFAAAGSGIVGVGASMTSKLAIIWDDTADADDVAVLSWTTPANFREVSVRRKNPGSTTWSDLSLWLLTRKLDTSGAASNNADLTITAGMYWLYSDPLSTSTTPGDTALNNLTTRASALLEADAAAATEEAFKWYELDLSARLQAETKTLKANSALDIVIGPNEAVGTDLAIEVIGAKLRYREHCAFESRVARIR